MIKNIKDRYTPKQVEIDLTGEEGNAFVLMGYARRFSTQLGLNPEPIINDMTSSDYEHLVNVFDKYFGDFVTLYR
jgi:hypothetical protein